MKLGIIIYSTDAETVWNAFRLGNFSAAEGIVSKCFCLPEVFNVPDQMTAFVKAGGEILACGTCLKIRQTEASDLCPLSTMQDMYDLVRDSDRVLTF